MKKTLFLVGLLLSIFTAAAQRAGVATWQFGNGAGLTDIPTNAVDATFHGWVESKAGAGGGIPTMDGSGTNLVVRNDAAGDVPLTVNATAEASGNLFEVQKDDNLAFYLDNAGLLHGDGSQLTGLPGGDVTLAGNNAFTGSNSFDGPTILGGNGSISNAAGDKFVNFSENGIGINKVAASGPALDVNGYISCSSIIGSGDLRAGASGNLYIATRLYLSAPNNGEISLRDGGVGSVARITTMGGATTALQWQTTNGVGLEFWTKTNQQNYAKMRLTAGTNSTELVALEAGSIETSNKLTGATTLITNGNAIFSGTVTATNGFLGASNVVFHMPTNAPTDGQVVTASGTSGITRWADATAGGGGTNRFYLNESTNTYIELGNTTNVLRIDALGETLAWWDASGLRIGDIYGVADGVVRLQTYDGAVQLNGNIGSFDLIRIEAGETYVMKGGVKVLQANDSLTRIAGPNGMQSITLSNGDIVFTRMSGDDFTATNGFVRIDTATFPTNSVPLGSATKTNTLDIVYGGLPMTVATNYQVGGWMRWRTTDETWQPLTP